MINREYKSTVFSLLFNNRQKLLSLYNALNHTSYTDPTDLQINTLEGRSGIFMKHRNDVSFVFSSQMSIYEHQSTVNPNMPLRDLFYFADLLRKSVKRKELYRETMIQIPAPRFVVFYNGKAKQPERFEYRLSDQYEIKVTNPEAELIVTVYNINQGMNRELLDRCKDLADYSVFVQRMQDVIFPEDSESERDIKALKVIKNCINDGILSEFLEQYRDEVIELYFWEYDEEAHRQAIEEDRQYAIEQGFKQGREQGLEQGLEQGREQGLEQGRMEERAITERERRRAELAEAELQRYKEKFGAL